VSIYNNDGPRNSTINNNNFMEVGANLKKVLNKVLKNDNLIKLLYYNTPNIQNEPNLTNEQKVAMINDYIKLAPRLNKDIEMKNYLLIQMDQFTALEGEQIFRTFVLNFDILCHSENWIMDDYMLRPFKIMHELDVRFNNSKLDSLGPVNFISANQLILNEDLMGYSMFFRIMDFQ
jgi:hypothetical protein